MGILEQEGRSEKLELYKTPNHFANSCVLREIIPIKIKVRLEGLVNKFNL
jgi:hypothetical protein